MKIKQNFREELEVKRKDPMGNIEMQSTIL